MESSSVEKTLDINISQDLSYLKVKEIQTLIMLSKLQLSKATIQWVMYRQENTSKVPN